MSFILVAIFAPFIAPHDPLKAGIVNRLRPPFWMERGSITNLLGADEIGR
ncbi:unnamed protein product, partial [marine sediment metagenome]